ncbi:MAG: hypothetical protein KDF64_21775, partial [Geminicoccaceae bacterium]|nr:hypothetical protein [Geminicoccaceae bacterium]
AENANRWHYFVAGSAKPANRSWAHMLKNYASPTDCRGVSSPTLLSVILIWFRIRPGACPNRRRAEFFCDCMVREAPKPRNGVDNDIKLDG